MKQKLQITLILLFTSFNIYSQAIDIQRLVFKSENLTSFNKVVIRNLYGDIRIRQTKQDSVVFHAVSQFSKQHQAKLLDKIENQTLYLEIKYSNPPKINSKERVDTVIILPKQLELNISIDKGNLSSKTIDNRIQVESDRSNISIKSTNSATLITKSGNIKFTLMPNNNSNKIQLISQSGSIRVDYDSKQIPRADITTGSIVTSNSVKFLTNKTIEKRVIKYRPINSIDMFQVQTDTGYIHFIEHKQI